MAFNPPPVRRGLHPEVLPTAQGWMATDGPHEIYWETVGAEDGKPALVLHGGPGGAINPTMRRFFDPSRWRTTLFDQRGCGLSRPHGSLEDNTTWALIADIERLRERLRIERWTVFGGSWGSTLALAYAISHPERVSALVLRGIFLLGARELRWFYQDGANMLFPDAWEAFEAPIPPQERGDMIAAYARRLQNPDPAVHMPAARAWAQWEGSTLSVRGPEGRPEKFEEDRFNLAFARIENHYFMNRAFFPAEDWILQHVDRIRTVPAWIVQGRFDVVTPMSAAWSLHRAWPEAAFEVVWDAGHASTEPGNVDALVRATEAAYAAV
jgi:proline iminopeptidase